MAKKKPIVLENGRVSLNGVHTITQDRQLRQLVIATNYQRFRIDYGARITVDGTTHDLIDLIMQAAAEQRITVH